MPDSFIVNVCLTGMVPTRRMNPAVPMTPEEIARDVEACIECGASIFHVHARDGKGEPDWRRETYEPILRAIRRVSADVVICVSTSGRRVRDPERRTACLDCEPRPDMGSLTLGSVDFLRDATLNPPEVVRGIAEAMKERGIKPELEIFDLGMARTAARLISEGLVESPAYANILLGNIGSADASMEDLSAIVRHLPEGVTWCVGGIGKAQLPANTLGMLFGHGVRVGLEDNLYMDREKTPATNPALVERVVRIGRLHGKRPSTIEETRRKLGL